MSQKEAFEFITVHRRTSDPRDESWHDDLSKAIWRDFRGTRTLWNWAWIEYNVQSSHVESLKTFLAKYGYRVSTGDDSDDDDE